VAEPLLQVENLSKRFGDLTALEGVTFALEAGEVLGVVGRPGAGKSTLLHLLNGFYAPSGGRICFEGCPVAFSNSRQAQRLGIEIVYQHPQLINNQDVVRNIFLGRELTGPAGLGKMNFDRMLRQARDLLADFDLPINLIGKRADALSAEQRQVVAIARGLSRPARLLLLDNSLAALSYQRQQILLDRIRALAVQDAAIVISSDDLKCLFAITDHLLVLSEGRQVALRRTAETIPSEIVDLIVGTRPQEQITPVVWALESYHATQKQTDELRRMQTTLSESLEAQASLNLQLIERLRNQIQALDHLEAIGGESNMGTQVRQAFSPVREAELITLARVLVAQGRLQPEGIYLREALTLLDRLLQTAETSHRIKATIEILALQAMAHQASGHPDLAAAMLKRALTLAETGDYLRVFVDGGRPMAALLQTLKAEGGWLSSENPNTSSASHLSHTAYVDKLLTAFRNTPGGQRKNESPESRPTAFTVLSIKEPLSEREQTVLNLIAVGLSTQEIAQELSVSTNTVKSHTKSIYGKLNVRNRLQAVKLAKELNLI
jgi:ABC-type branched-subunit amino acid transport system ATPase component/DNA-binding CsgD family transcriptional regulator